MTAEICLMNTIGVAMAADSAVTIGSGRKIYNTANKLFSLSKHHPVGVMIFGNANYLRVPWETIIKIYRKKIGAECFDKIEDYANDFLEFLKTNTYEELISSNEEENFILSTIDSDLSEILVTLINILKERVNDKPDITESELNLVSNNHIEILLEGSSDQVYIDPFNEEDYRILLHRYDKKIDDMIRETFENLIYSDSMVTSLKYIVINNLLKTFSDSNSGIVFSGFGEKELYPSLRSFNIEGRINGKVKYQELTSHTINKDSASAIIPFAQDDMVYSFLRGVDRDLESFSENYLSSIFDQLPDIVVKELNKINANTNSHADELKDILKKGLSDIYEEYNKQLFNFSGNNYTVPTLNIVSSLPKDELAEMAESLVNLTSFKRRVSNSLETVGGPVDVAVITKGDGLIWIKRKHYFKPELNQQFHENHSRR
jgi:hypothetical protein